MATIKINVDEYIDATLVFTKFGLVNPADITLGKFIDWLVQCFDYSIEVKAKSLFDLELSCEEDMVAMMNLTYPGIVISVSDEYHMKFTNDIILAYVDSLAE